MTGSMRGALMGAALLSGLAAPAVAQDAAPAAADGQNWTVQCGEAGAAEEGQAAERVCVMLQNLAVTQGETTQRLLTVLIQPDGAGGRQMVLALPHGLLLPAGAQYAIDGGAATTVTIRTSDGAGAYAPAPFTDELAQAMSAGAQMTVTFQAANGQAVNVPVTLSGFAQAYGNLVQGVATAAPAAAE